MARIDADALREPERVFVAGTLRQAQEAEARLTMSGIDYAVEVESIGRSLIFGTERMGAAFYVHGTQADYCREQLTAAGLSGGVVFGLDE